MRKQTKVWTTKDGRRIRICNMSSVHISNTIAMLERKTELVTEAMLDEAYGLTSFLQGEMAQFSIECDIRRLEEGVSPSELFPIYENLILERERRNESW